MHLRMSMQLPKWMDESRESVIKYERDRYNRAMENKYPADMWNHAKERAERSRKEYAFESLKHTGILLGVIFFILYSSSDFAAGVLITISVLVYIFVLNHHKSNEPDWDRRMDPRNDDEIKEGNDIDMRIQYPDFDRKLWVSKHNYTESYIASEILEEIEKSKNKMLSSSGLIDNEELFDELLILAEQGDAQRQLELGDMYHGGKGVSKDNEKAVYWYIKSAEQGYAEAQYVLGHVYDMGVIAPRDISKSIYWFRKAAIQGHSNAQFVLGNRHAAGEGVQKDITQAIFWYQQAAEHGSLKAINHLVDIYANGQSVSQDDAQAVFWYHKAAEHGDVQAKYELGNRYFNGNGVPQDEAIAIYWYQEAAKHGHDLAKNILGNLSGTERTD